MREILFRGKSVNDGRWIFGDLSSYGDCKTITTTKDFTIVDSCEVVPETVGQYTGMTDKNGNKIFEGDIVKVGNALVRGIFAVEYSGMGACFIVSCGESRYFLGGCSSEVIGNIHD